MYQIRRIMVCTDLSSPARHAAARAAMLAAALDARLDVACVISTAWLDRLQSHVESAPPEIARRVQDTTAQSLEELATSLRAASGARVDARLVDGPVVPTLLAEAQRTHADLIVAGAHGAGFMRRALLGSTAERMIRKARSPILVVKQVAHEPYRRALLALDLSPVSGRVIEAGRAVAPRADLLPLHAYELVYESKMRYAGIEEPTILRYREAARAECAAQLARVLDEAGRREGLSNALLTHGDPVTCILEQEQERDCDLIVVGKQGEGKIEELILGSVTKHVLHGSQADVLIAA